MKIIKELTDLEVIGKVIPKAKEDYRIRIAARAIILDRTGNIAILSTSKSKDNYHKLPGGGLEDSEDVTKTLKREIKEEVGCEIEILKEVGEIIEYKNEYNQKQTSYCFLAKIKGQIGKANFTKEEREAGFKLEWVPIGEAIKLFKDSTPKDYTARYIQVRDYTFLLEAKRLLG